MTLLNTNHGVHGDGELTCSLLIVTDLDEPRFLVELVLDLAPFRDLHDLSQRSQPYVCTWKKDEEIDG